MRWFLGYRRLWGRAPASTRVPGVQRGGGDIMTCQAASHHTGLPARQRSTTTSVYIIDGVTDGGLGRMRSEQLQRHTCVMFHQQLRKFKWSGDPLGCEACRLLEDSGKEHRGYRVSTVGRNYCDHNGHNVKLSNIDLILKQNKMLH